MMAKELDQATKLKKAIFEHERNIEKQTDEYKSLGGVGGYYDIQRRK